MTNSTPKALAQYRALDTIAKSAYDPSGKPGAERIRELQKIARLVSGAKIEGENIARNIGNPQFPAWKKTNGAMLDLFRAAGYTMPGLVRDAQCLHLIPLGTDDEEIAINAARRAHPRRTNWGDVRASIVARPVGATIDEAFEYRGKHKARTGYIYHPTMQSAARISNDGAILTAIIGHSDDGARPMATHIVQAGRGYKWKRDANGVRLVRLADGADYHPSSDEIRAGRAAIIAALRERAEARKKAAITAKRDAKIITAACKDGIFVGLADAIAAGNCRAGTANFARRHGLDIRRHYRADQLPRGSGDTSRRVALAVLASQRRQVRDQERGFCEI
jgi:hypothetical protein